MKRATSAQLEERIATLSKSEGLLMRALNAVMNHETEFPVAFFAKTVIPDEPGRYIFRFFDHESPSGEKVLITYSRAGQKDYTAIYYADEQQDAIRRDPGGIWSRIFYHALANRKRKPATAEQNACVRPVDTEAA